MIHNFQKSLSQSEGHETKIDDWLRSKGYEVYKVPMELQKQGVDRILIKDNFRTLVEYKTDFHSARTGNIYIETIAHRAEMTLTEALKPHQKLGWIYHSIANLMLYRIVNTDIIYIFKLEDLRTFYKQNKSNYDTITVKNEGFEGTGRLVPIADISTILKAYKFN